MFRKIDFFSIKDDSEAMWLKEHLEQPWGRGDGCNYATSIIPKGYECYARIFHPGYLGNEDREITWTELALLFKRMPHSQMQWHKIVNCNSPDFKHIKLAQPAIGHFPRKQAEAFIKVLSKFTDTPDDCLFAVWSGWDGLEAEKYWPDAARFQTSDREYILLGGSIEAAVMSVLPFCEQSATVWWPRDRAWCVATDIDLMWTYVGGTKHCIDEILLHNGLEAWPASLDDRVDINGDKIN